MSKVCTSCQQLSQKLASMWRDNTRLKAEVESMKNIQERLDKLFRRIEKKVGKAVKRL